MNYLLYVVFTTHDGKEAMIHLPEDYAHELFDLFTLLGFKVSLTNSLTE